MKYLDTLHQNNTEHTWSFDGHLLIQFMLTMGVHKISQKIPTTGQKCQKNWALFRNLMVFRKLLAILTAFGGVKRFLKVVLPRRKIARRRISESFFLLARFFFRIFFRNLFHFRVTLNLI